MTTDPQTPAVIAGITPGITIRGLGRDQRPIVDVLCSCGAHERATGHTAARKLTARARHSRCPHVNPEPPPTR